jgi:GNAT superfamily N-acetyltransferase
VQASLSILNLLYKAFKILTVQKEASFLSTMIELKRTSSDNEDFRSLVMELDCELRSRYDKQQASYDQYNIIQNNQSVLVAYKNGVPVGCGCFKKFDDASVEIKRMYVKREYRGQKIAATILSELEKWVQELNVFTAVLETGSKQPEAIHLYKKSGYIVIENYGPYKNMPQSVCMQKKLSQ